MPKGVYTRKPKLADKRKRKYNSRVVNGRKLWVPKGVNVKELERTEEQQAMVGEIANLKRQIELKDKLINILVQWSEYENLPVLVRFCLAKYTWIQ